MSWCDDCQRLLSLWDIVNKFSLADVTHCLGMLSGLEGFYSSLKIAGKGGENTSQKLKEVIGTLETLKVLFKESGMPDCEQHCGSAIYQLSRPRMDVSSTAAFLYTFREAVMRSLKGRFFLQILTDRSEYLDQEQLFGEKVSDAFPSADRDIKEAGNCLASESSTASVFHLMRAVEFALLALAADREIVFKNKPLDDAQWGEILSALEGRLVQLRNAPRTSWPQPNVRDSQIRFYNEVIQEIRSFNDAWRRHVSHAGTLAFYERDDALGILKHVRALMQKMAPKISETSVTPEFWTTA